MGSRDDIKREYNTLPEDQNIVGTYHTWEKPHGVTVKLEDFSAAVIHTREKPHDVYVKLEELDVSILEKMEDGDEPVWVCDVCWSIFDNRPALDEHKATHTGRRRSEGPKPAPFFAMHFYCTYNSLT